MNRFLWSCGLAIVVMLGGCQSDEVEPVSDDPATPSEPTDPSSQEPEPEPESEPEVSPFSDGPYGVTFRETVGDIEAATLGGNTFSLRDLWTGDDSFIFLFYTNNPEQSPDLVTFLDGLWFPGGSSAGSIEELIEASPKMFITYLVL